MSASLLGPEPLAAHYDTSAFDCGSPALNACLAHFALTSQSGGRGQNVCRIARGASGRLLRPGGRLGRTAASAGPRCEGAGTPRDPIDAPGASRCRCFGARASSRRSLAEGRDQAPFAGPGDFGKPGAGCAREGRSRCGVLRPVWFSTFADRFPAPVSVDQGHEADFGAWVGSKSMRHSITSSARTSTDCGILMPSALAVRKLITR